MCLLGAAQGGRASTLHPRGQTRKSIQTKRAYAAPRCVPTPISQPVRLFLPETLSSQNPPPSLFRITAGVQVRAVGATETVRLQPPHVSILPQAPPWPCQHVSTGVMPFRKLSRLQAAGRARVAAGDSGAAWRAPSTAHVVRQASRTLQAQVCHPMHTYSCCMHTCHILCYSICMHVGKGLGLERLGMCTKLDMPC